MYVYKASVWQSVLKVTKKPHCGGARVGLLGWIKMPKIYCFLLL